MAAQQNRRVSYRFEPPPAGFVCDTKSPDSQKPKLLDRVRSEIRRRNYSRRTEKSYVGWIRRFILFHRKRHPAEMGKAEISRFLTHLAVNRKVSASTQNQAFNALLFLYREVLDTDIGRIEDIVRAKRPIHLPVVLTRSEVAALLGNLHGIEWIMASLLYGAGLRLLECCRLRVKDLDLERREIMIRNGKGAKDRVTVFPARVFEPLTAHLERIRCQHEDDLQKGLGSVELPAAAQISRY